MLGQVLRALSLAAGVIVLVAGSVGSSSALPVSSGLRHQGNASGSPIQKVHGWHCRRRYGWVRHCHRRYCHTHKKWHRHRGALDGRFSDSGNHPPPVRGRRRHSMLAEARLPEGKLRSR